MLPMKKFLFIGLVVLFCSCDNEEPVSYSYLALGDSYTIGEGVTAEERWPDQLAERLSSNGMAVRKPVVIARTG